MLTILQKSAFDCWLQKIPRNESGIGAGFDKKRRYFEVKKDENPMKLLKMGSGIEMEANSMQVKLNDINDECLEKVFMHLSLDDLLAIAHTNKKLKTAANMAFVNKFGSKRFYFKISTYSRSEAIDMSEHEILIYDFKTSLRLLRCYGHLISDLAIEYDGQFYTAPVMVLYYVNQYCSKSLEKVSFHRIFELAFEFSLDLPFAKIEMVHFDCCILGEKMSKFNNWFPALRCLSLHASRFIDRSSIAVQFPRLEELDLVDMFPECLTPENVNALFRLNPQLRCVSMDPLHTSQHLQSVNQHLPLLENLTILCRAKHIASRDEIQFDSVKRLAIRFPYPHRGGNPRVNILCKQVEEVDIDFGPHKSIRRALFFFEQNQSITKLELAGRLFDYRSDTDKENMRSIVAALPLLNSFTFHQASFSVEEVIEFLAEFNLINTFCFSISNSSQFHRLRAILSDEWESSISGRYVELRRTA